MPSPDRATVLAQAQAGNSYIPIWRTWPADLETPLTTWLKVGAGSDHGVLLESVEGGERIGRWSFVVSDPLWLQEPLQYRLEWITYAPGWMQPYECMEESWFERIDKLATEAGKNP